jgi:phenylpropionate dioxygenase-like ring-hydroxylating dioxygenase large terminal subunit
MNLLIKFCFSQVSQDCVSEIIPEYGIINIIIQTYRKRGEIMIRNQWYAVLDSKEVKTSKLTGVQRMGEELVFWRTSEGEIVCMQDLCPHRGVALSTGKLIKDHLQCPFHGFEFAASGQCTLIPANGRNGPIPKAMRVATYPAREQHGFIWIWWGEEQDNLPEIPFFDTIDQSFHYSTLKDHWKTHYSRAIENQLDVLHLPFIHRSTIGRGNQTVVDGPLTDCCLDGQMIQIWYSNRVDDGRPARSSKELPQPAGNPLIQFIFPNVWQNWLGDDFRLVIAFVPIDDQNTRMYVRTYQRVVKVPILKFVFNIISGIGNFIIERQDRWVVQTQKPKRTGLRTGERLVPGDRPIVLYRQRREALIAGSKEESE